jgi:hypothetical protein
MLSHPTLSKLNALRLYGIGKSLAEQLKDPDIGELTFEDRFGLVVDREITERENKKLATRLKKARLLPDLVIAKGIGTHMKRLNEFAKADVLILDDWGLISMNDDNRRDLLEILDDRHCKRSTIVTSQLPIKHWHENINDNTLADAILDRLVHNAHRIELKGESMRKVIAEKLKSELNLEEISIKK